MRRIRQKRFPAWRQRQIDKKLRDAWLASVRRVEELKTIQWVNYD